MQGNELFNVVEIFKVVVDFVDVPVPPLDTQQRFDNVFGKSELDDFCGVAADDCIWRNVLDDDAVRSNNRTVADNERFVGIIGL